MANDKRISGALWASFVRVAATGRERVAIESPQASLSFTDALNLTEQLAGDLRRHGVSEGSVVHVVLPNHPIFLPALLALNKLGATVGLVSARYRDAEHRALVERVAPAAYLTTPALADVLARSIAIRDKRAISLEGQAVELALAFPEASPADPSHMREGLALLKFTSGSTGAPKGVGLTEANLLAEAANVVATLGIEQRDRILVPVPISHSYGFDLGLLPVIVAGAGVALRGAFIPREVIGDLARPETTIFLGVPSMYRVLLETELAEVPNLSHVRYLLSCTAPLLPTLIIDFHRRFRIPICQHYGSSETGAISNHVPSRVLDRPASVGAALANVEIRILGPEGELLDAGQEGEIVIRSHAVAGGYVTDESPGNGDLFRQVDAGRSEYRTGDLGVLDHEGFLFWRGRKDHVINVGGLKVYPSEVVRVLESCPSVASARVLGQKDPSGEEVVHAVVSVSQSIREQDILDYCRKHLADYKVPRRIEITDTIATPESAKMANLTGDIHL
ncbi:MAG TPA: class I adenylate-forming enzyme family protein [Baekduia sp.]|nr:class I adenylate-forming enzyme family protein [Baekduia sp.]